MVTTNEVEKEYKKKLSYTISNVWRNSLPPVVDGLKS